MYRIVQIFIVAWISCICGIGSFIAYCEGDIIAFSINIVGIIGWVYLSKIIYKEHKEKKHLQETWERTTDEIVEFNRLAAERYDRLFRLLAMQLNQAQLTKTHNWKKEGF